VAQVKQQTSTSSLGSLPANSPALNVSFSNNGTTFGGALADTARACPTADQQTQFSSVKVNVDLQNAGLPQALKDIFVVDIPMMPPISLKGAQINGVFRCEGN